MHLRHFLSVPALMLAALVSNLAAAEDACPVTTPPSPPFVPPAPYQPNASPNTFWYGTNALWTRLRVEGVWRGLPPTESGYGYSNKLFLWQQGYDVGKEPHPDITVVAKRLDAQAPLVKLRHGTNAFFDDTWAMLTGVDFPTEGCWEVTSSHAGHKLTFVVSIEP